MGARYLLRLDDACDTMDHAKWAAVEQVLDRHSVRPIVAVVPDNHDPVLAVCERDEMFWGKVRSWAAKGWSVAMHGYTHVMPPTEGALLVPFYRRSEFAGRSLDEQALMIRAAWELFLAQGISPGVWVAPAHSFDILTLEAIRKETSIRIVSDGIACDSYYEHGFHWIPQQLWNLASRPLGLWTVCLHPNGMSESDIEALDQALTNRFSHKIVQVGDVRLSMRKKGLLGQLYHEYFWWRWRREVAALADTAG